MADPNTRHDDPPDADNHHQHEQEQNEEDDEPDTQEDVYTQSQNELTQMACDLDCTQTPLSPNCTPGGTKVGGGGSQSQSQSQLPQSPPVNLRTIPWGRLIPCSGFGSEACGMGRHHRTAGGEASGGNNEAGGGGNGGLGGQLKECGAGGFDLLPRDPLDSSRPSAAAATCASAASTPAASAASAASPQSPSSASFLGLSNLRNSDRFNEFLFGRSVKCDLIVKKQPKEEVEEEQGTIDGNVSGAADGKDGKAGTNSKGGGGKGSSSNSNSRAEQRNKNNDWVHAMISNKHCRIYCLLKPTTTGGGNTSRSAAASASSRSKGGRGHQTQPSNVEMEVYVEDTSGNGTLINNTTLLSRSERRLLHTGDEICLINPATLRRRVRSTEEAKELVRHYSYIFVNLFQQQGRFGEALGIGMGGGVGCSSSSGGGGGRITTPGGYGNNRAAGGGGYYNSGGQPSGGRRRGMVDVTKISSSQDRNNVMMMPPPPPSSAKGGGAAGAGAGAASGNGGGKLFSSVIARSNSSKQQQNQQNEQRRMQQPNHQPRQHQQQQQQQQQRHQARRRIEDHYDIRDLLGSGTCGEVRRCIHRRSGQQHAVKIISIGGGIARGGANRANRLAMSDAAIQAEASILQALDHPYIVKLIDVFVAPDRAIYLVMEMLNGGDLFDRIVDKGRYTEIESRRIMRRLLAAVHYLHKDREIVHRDLKPENILCVSRADDVTVKLTDFGLAKSVTEEGLKTFCGTPQYFAPEVLRRRHTVAGRGRYSYEADMWSLGVILYILLSGAPPFDVTDSIDVVAEAQISFPDDKWSDVSDEAKDLVTRLLVTDPTERLSVVAACEHGWIGTEDGDTHCHPLDDPALGTKMRVVPTGSTAAAASGTAASARGTRRSTNAAIIDVVHPKPAQSVLTSPSPAKKRLQFQDGTAAAMMGGDCGHGGSRPRNGEAKAADKCSASSERATDGREHAVGSSSTKLPPIQKGREQSATKPGSQGAGKRLRPSPRSIVLDANANPAATPPKSNVTPSVKASKPKAKPATKVTGMDGKGENSTRSKPKGRSKAKAAREPHLELTDDEIISDFSDDEENDSIHSFGDSAPAAATSKENFPPRAAAAGKSSAEEEKKSDDGDAPIQHSPPVSSASIHGEETGRGSKRKQPETSGQKGSDSSRKVKRTLAGKRLAKEGEAVPEMAESLKETESMTPSSDTNVQQTLTGKAAVKEAEHTGADSPCKEMAELAPKESPASSTGKVKQTTLASWFKKK